MALTRDRAAQLPALSEELRPPLLYPTHIHTDGEGPAGVCDKFCSHCFYVISLFYIDGGFPLVAGAG